MQIRDLPQAFFLETSRGRRFCLFHQVPNGHTTHGALIYIHPFADEMNLSRRMAAAQARAFASAGYAVLLIDLYGCGDSDGDFESATWDIWRDDVVQAQAWLATRAGHVAMWLWGLRAGCLLAAEVATLHAALPTRLLLWQPVVSGRQHLNQLLRLSLVSDMARGVRALNTEQLAQKLALGDSVEVGGYSISPLLAVGLARATLEGLPAGLEVACIEVQNAAANGFSPAITAQLARWQASGCHVNPAVVEGAPFWQVAESSVCGALVTLSLAIVSNQTQGNKA